MPGKSSVVRVAIVADNSSLNRGLKDSQVKLTAFGKQASKLGSVIGVSAGFGLAALAKSAVDVEAAFGKTMRTIAAVTNAPAEEIKQLNDLAVQLGQNTVFSANEAAQAMLALSKAGIDSKTIYEGAADATLGLATAAGTDLETAATIAANAMNAFNVEAKDLTRVTTALVGGANASTASVESLQMGLAQVGAGARNAGLNFNETVAVLAEFDNAGIKGSDAGTSLKTMLQRLVPQTDKAAGAMKELGLNFVDAQGNFKSITEIAEELRTGFKGLTQEQTAAALQTIFGSDATRAATVLMRGGGKELRKYLKATRDKTAAERAAKAATEGTSGALERISSTIETAQLKLGQALAPAISEVADWLSAHLVPAMEAGIENAKVFGNAMEPLVGILKDLAVVVGDLAGFLNGLPDPIKTLAFQIGLAKVAFDLLGKGIDGSTARLRLWSAEAAAATGKTSLLSTATFKLAGIAKTAAGIGGMALLGSSMANASDKGVTMGNVLSGALGGAMTGLAVGGPIGALIGAVGGGGLSALTAALSSTADEAKVTRAELMRTEGFEQAKADADSLREALVGVVNVYSEVTRAAVKGSFLNKDGKLDRDVAMLRQAGVSMDTIVSATMGQADAQAAVAQSFGGTIGRLSAIADDAEAAWLEAKDATVEYRNEQGLIVSQHLSTEQQKIYKDAWLEAKDAVEEAEAAQEAFGTRIEGNTGAIADHRKQVQGLAEDLGLTVRQYDALPKEVRTRFEGEGLPQTFADAKRLVAHYKELQNFRSIRALISAPGVEATREQIRRLAEQYKLTPKQVQTLFKTAGTGQVKAEAQSVVDALKNTQDEAGDAGATVGSRWGAGVVSGISSQQVYAAQQARYLVQLTTAAAQAEQDSHSPSRVMFKEGQNFGQGYINGIASLQRQAAEQGAKLTGAALKGAKKVVKAIGGIQFGVSRDVGEQESLINEQLRSVTERIQKYQDRQSRHAVAVYQRELNQKQRALERSLKKQGIKGPKAAARLRAAGLGDAQIDRKVRDREKREARENRRALRSLDKQYAALREVGRLQDVNNEKLRLATEHYDDLVKQSEDYAASIKDAFVAFGDITQLGRNEEDATVSFGALIDQLKTRRNAAQDFQSLLTKFAGMGLDKTVIDQLIAAGPEAALATARAIDFGITEQGAQAIQDINDLTRDIAKAGGQLGATLNATFNDQGIAIAKGVVAGLEAEQENLNRSAEAMADALVKQVRKALGIASPSKVMFKIGQQSGQGLALGFNSTYATTAGTRMASALVSSFGSPQLHASAIGNGRAGDTATLHVEVQLTAQQLSALERGRAIQLDLDAYRSAGGRGATR